MVIVDVSVLQLLVATVLPIVVGVVTQKVAHSGVKAVALLFLSGVTSAVGAAISAGGVFDQATVVQALVNFVVAVATYYGLWHPTGVTEAVQDKTPCIGFVIKEQA
jgi:Ni,Fe-hydrogenase III small subunit